MAKKSTTSKNLDSEVASELEKALDMDLSAETGDLDIAASMEDLEAQISRAADELARAGRSERPAAAAAQAEPAKPAAQKPAAPELRPLESRNGVESRNGAQPSFTPAPGFAPANDDRQKDYRSLLHTLNRRSSTTIYWVVAFVSLAWIAGAGALANLLFGSDVWKIRSLDQLTAQP
ncbi:MAG TPA: hypothetical protein VGM46_03685, partial [Mesorhizobium sp.]